MRKDYLKVKGGGTTSLPQGWVCMGCLTCLSAQAEPVGTSKALCSRAGTQELEPGATGSRSSFITKLNISHTASLLLCSHLAHGVSYPYPIMHWESKEIMATVSVGIRSWFISKSGVFSWGHCKENHNPCSIVFVCISVRVGTCMHTIHQNNIKFWGMLY